LLDEAPFHRAVTVEAESESLGFCPPRPWRLAAGARGATEPGVLTEVSSVTQASGRARGPAPSGRRSWSQARYPDSERLQLETRTTPRQKTDHATAAKPEAGPKQASGSRAREPHTTGWEPAISRHCDSRRHSGTARLRHASMASVASRPLPSRLGSCRTPPPSTARSRERCAGC
jgi:hypothetical protein